VVYGPIHEVNVHVRWIKVVVFALGQRSIVINFGMYWLVDLELDWLRIIKLMREGIFLV